MNINPIYLKDAYKVGHIYQYPPNTTLVFNNFTPRKSRMHGVNHSVWFGLTYFLRNYLQDCFNDNFFYATTNSENVMINYNEIMYKLLGDQHPAFHIRDLHKLGYSKKHEFIPYIPIAIYALPEGAIVPCGVPAMVIYNTHPDYFWLPGMLETLISCTLWPMCTSATIAREYRLILDKYAEETSDIPEFVDYQAHDFSMRGMFGVEAAIMSGMAHLQYFKGTDTIPAVLAAQEYYDRIPIIASVPATEHSVMCAYGQEAEYETFKRLITEVYPEGIVSIVSDSWDLWNVVSNYLPRLKSTILNRNGKVVIRPDSGDPVDILCGYERPYFLNENKCEYMGLIESLWEIFGGTINAKGYKQLDPHIGAIYGDSISLDRCYSICQRLKDKGFASTNVVFGIGSFSYQYNTRDTLGWAMKATYCEVDGKGRNIFKDPVTDDGTKKSHKGILKVVCDISKPGFPYKVLQEQTWNQFHEEDNELKLVFKDGVIY